jgi:anti-sigma-K factor RskA
MRSHDEYRDDCAAYALGALGEDEVAALHAHLETCDECRLQLERLAAVTEALGRAVSPLAPPPALRARVLDAVAAEAGQLAPAARATRRPARRRIPRFAFQIVAAAALALALGLLVGTLALAPGGSSTRVVSAAVAPAQRWGASRSPVAQLRVTGTTAELVVSQMPPAPAGKVYEVWIERDDRADPTDVLFNPTAGGEATVAVPSTLHGAQAVLVTAERSGGSRVPTMSPLITASLG